MAPGKPQGQPTRKRGGSQKKGAKATKNPTKAQIKKRGSTNKEEQEWIEKHRLLATENKVGAKKYLKNYSFLMIW